MTYEKIERLAGNLLDEKRKLGKRQKKWLKKAEALLRGLDKRKVKRRDV